MEGEIYTAPAGDLHQIMHGNVQEHPVVSGWLKSAKLGDRSELEMDDVDPDKLEEEIDKITMMAYSFDENFLLEEASAGAQQRKSRVRRSRPKGKMENLAQLTHGRAGPHKQAQQTILKYQAKSTVSFPLQRPRLSPLAARAALAAAVEAPQLGCTAALSIVSKKSSETLVEEKPCSAKRRLNTGHAVSNFGINKGNTCLKLMDVDEKIEQKQTEASGTKRKRGRPSLRGPQLKVDTCLGERDAGQSMKDGGGTLKRSHRLLGRSQPNVEINTGLRTVQKDGQITETIETEGKRGCPPLCHPQPEVDTCLRGVDATQKIQEQNTNVIATVRKRGCPDLYFPQPKPDLSPVQTDSSESIEEQREMSARGVRKRGRPPPSQSRYQVERHQLKLNVMPKVEEQINTYSMEVDTTKDLENRKSPTKHGKNPTGTVRKRGRSPLDPLHLKGKIHQVEFNVGEKAEDQNEKDTGLVRNRDCCDLDHPQARVDMQLRKMDAAQEKEHSSEMNELARKKDDPALYKRQPHQSSKVVESHLLNQWLVLPDNITLDVFIDLPVEHTAIPDWNRHALNVKTQEQTEEKLMAKPVPPESSDLKEMAVKANNDDTELNTLSTDIFRPKSRKETDKVVGKNQIDVEDDGINCEPQAGVVGALVGGKHAKTNNRENRPTGSLLDNEANVSGNPSSFVTVASGGEGGQKATGGWPVSSASIDLAVDLVANAGNGDSQSLAMHTKTIGSGASPSGCGLGITGGLSSLAETQMPQSTHSLHKIQTVTTGKTATQSSSSDVAAAVKQAPE